MPYTVLANASDDRIRSFLLLELSFPSGTLRYTDCDFDIVALGHTWNRDRGFRVTGIAATQGDNAGAEITLDNGDNGISAVLFGTPNPARAELAIHEAWFNPDSNHTNIPDDTVQLLIGRVGQLSLPTDAVKRVAVITVAPYCEFRSVVVPRRTLTPKCTFIFKESHSCQYAGADTSCLRTKIDCNGRSNASNYGGFEMVTGG